MKSKFFFIFNFVLIFSFCQSAKQNSADKSHIVEHVTIYASHDEYCAWPAMVRAANGDLLVSFCINEEHLGPDGEIVTVRSMDNGKTWSQPEKLLSTPIDDRHAGLTVLNDGSIIAHCWSTFWTPEQYRNLAPNSYEPDMIERWVKHVEQPDYISAANEHGSRGMVSSDNGHTWSEPMPGKDSIHGGLQLPDGTLLLASYRLDNNNVGVYSCEKVGDPWKKIATVKSPKPDSIRIGEPHILRLPSGRILMMIRATAIPYNDGDPRCFLLETYSDDNGKTWVEPFWTPMWGFPPHLLLLDDGRVLCTYGHRRPPFGQRAIISDDGITWDIKDEIILRDDAYNKDLGYPVSVELEPGLVLSVYYQPDPKDGPQKMDPPDPERSQPDILGTIWRVPAQTKN